MKLLRKVKRIARRIQPLMDAYHKVTGLRIAGKSADEVFCGIYLNNGWGGSASISGKGSDLDQTAALSVRLPSLFNELGVRMVLDVPCGDFHWMKNVDLSGVSYIGGDIVEALVEKNRSSFSTERVSFTRLNLLTDDLPEADLVLCRDCMVHLSYEDVFAALNRIAESGARYLLATTFPARNKNCDIVTGQWRPLNLQLEPFCLPEPIQVIIEGCTEDDGEYCDKSMALWSMESLRDALNKCGRRYDD